MKNFLLSIILIAILNGCSSIILVPKQDNAISTNPIEISLQFAGVNYTYYTFDVEITNKTDKEITITPSLISQSVFNKKGKKIPIMDKKYEYAISAKNELEIIKSNALIHGCCFLFSTTALYTSSVVDDYATKNETNLERNARIAKQDRAIKNNQQNYEAKSSEFDEKIDFWTNQVLHKTVLKPGQSVKGKICFKKVSGNSYLIKIPSNMEVFYFKFYKQKDPLLSGKSEYNFEE